MHYKVPPKDISKISSRASNDLEFTTFVDMDSPVFGQTRFLNGAATSPVFGQTRFPNGAATSPVFGQTRFLNGAATSPAFGQTRFPNGAATSPVFGQTSFLNGAVKSSANGHKNLSNGAMNSPAFEQKSYLNGVANSSAFGQKNYLNGVANSSAFGRKRYVNGSVNSPALGEKHLQNDAMWTQQRECVLSVHNINYEVQEGSRFCRKMIKKRILYDITGVFKQGLTAIMGASGSGKSTLLDILASRKDPSQISGQILFKGKPVSVNFKYNVGYVIQDDIAIGTLTVRENIHFSAALRLPTSMRTAERNERVESVIRELGLSKCADTKIGTQFLRGVSGGEKKRCSIGMELIISPTVLFLDEPTTGLDADTALVVVKLLKKLSRGGRTIIFSIHQPRYAIFSLFDNLVLLSQGHMIYSGPSDESLDFFATQGFRCSIYNNPADFFLDIINGQDQGKDDDFMNEDYIVAQKRNNKRLRTGFLNSRWNTRLQREAKAILANLKAGGIEKPGKGEMRAKSFLHETRVLASRSLKNIVRDPVSSIFPILVSVVFALILDAMYWQLSTNPSTTFKNRNGVIFFIIINQLFLNLTALETFKDDRKHFIHEHISGFYRVSSYFVVKITFDILPVRMVPTVTIACLVYFIVDLHPGAGHFFLFLLSLFCLCLAASGLCFLYSVFFRLHIVAQMSLGLTYVLMILFGVYFVSIDTIGPWLSWAQYLSIFKYASQAIQINEFKGRMFCNSNSTICKSGDEFLAEDGISFATAWDFWSNLTALLIIAVVTCVLAYIQLRCMKKTL